jgi:YegS/Rv2252/BmrU family lipid kinase
MRTFTAVVNPTAGDAASARTLIPLARLLREAGAALTVEYSKGLDHAGELARAAAAQGHVVLGVGGDGMIGGVGGALIGTGATYGIVPAGRGNDFARQLRLPTAPADLADLLLNGAARPVDAIEANGNHVLGSVYAGVDAVANVHANNSWLRGRASYTFAALQAIVAWKPTTYTVTIDGEAITRRAFTVVAANSGFYGFGRRIAPGARVDDGLLDVIIVKHASRRLFITMMNELSDGSHVRRPEVEVLRGREVRIEASRPLPYGADGELPGTLPVLARVLPSALQVIQG